MKFQRVLGAQDDKGEKQSNWGASPKKKGRRKMNIEALSTALYEKMHAEQEIYRNWLLTQTREEILNHAYEYTIREDILLCLEECDLSEQQVKALLTSSCPLADVYRDFEKKETAHMEIIQNTIEHRANVLMKQNKRQIYQGAVTVNENKTIGEARKKPGEPVLAGHDIMALERFGENTRHMIVFDVLSHDSPVGNKGERVRLFLSDVGYQKALESQSRGECKIRRHAKVFKGDIFYDRPKEQTR